MNCIFQKSDAVYMCVGCNFKKDINQPPPKKEPPDLRVMAAIGLGTFLLLSLLGRLRPQPINPNPITSLPPAKSAIINPFVGSQK